MKQYSIIIIVLMAFGFASCEEFLSEAPSKTSSVVPSKTEHFENLLNSYDLYAKEGNYDLIFGSDDYGLLPELYDAFPNMYDFLVANYATWDVQYLPEIENWPYWNAEWPKVFNANLILMGLDKVEGTEEEILNLKAEAHFLRAYSYYQMVNTYCLPYSAANLDELGLPIKASTSFEESAERATLGETWDMIIADLNSALAINRDLELIGGKYRTWRASKPAVNAFAARVYLTMGDYPKAQKYAQDALSGHAVLVDYNTEMRYSDILTQVPVGGSMIRIWYPYTHDRQRDPTDRMEWKELYYYRFLSHSRWNYIPSPELLNTYDAEYDLRYKYHIVEDYSFDRGAPISYPGYVFFFKDDIPSGPTTAEMLLVKAECQARQGQWQEGLNTANQLRAKRIDSSAPADRINLSASGQADALKQILEERRRELPFTQRFFDVRRYNNNDYGADDVVMERNFYPVGKNVVEVSKGVQKLTLAKDSRNFARPLPDIELVVTEGTLKPN